MQPECALICVCTGWADGVNVGGKALDHFSTQAPEARKALMQAEHWDIKLYNVAKKIAEAQREAHFSIFGKPSSGDACW